MTSQVYGVFKAITISQRFGVPFIIDDNFLVFLALQESVSYRLDPVLILETVKKLLNLYPENTSEIRSFLFEGIKIEDSLNSDFLVCLIPFINGGFYGKKNIYYVLELMGYLNPGNILETQDLLFIKEPKKSDIGKTPRVFLERALIKKEHTSEIIFSIIKRNDTLEKALLDVIKLKLPPEFFFILGALYGVMLYYKPDLTIVSKILPQHIFNSLKLK